MRTRLTQRPALVVAVLRYEERGIGALTQYKAVAQLIDGSRLHINEVWVDNILSKYAYYWLTSAGAMLQGWDNAPHHPQVETYPHHTHRITGIERSDVRTLDDVLDELAHRLSV